MTAIPAASAGVRDLADGSLRITLEFEPIHAKDAYTLFGTRGTPVAVAALVAGYAAVPEPVKNKGGALSKEAAILCSREDFQKWIVASNAGDAAYQLRLRCDVESRAEFDTDPSAGERFIRLVRMPFMRYLNQQQEKAA